MVSPGNAMTKPQGFSLWLLFAPLAAIAALHLALVLNGFVPALEGQFVGTDTHSHLVRVLGLHETGDWFDSRIDRINPPEGHVSHWTRPFDALLYVGAWGLALFSDFEQGLFWWGVALGPVLHLATLLVLLWSAGPIFDRRWRGLLCLLFIAQPALVYVFLPGRPDHQSLLLLLQAGMLGCTIRLLYRSFSRGLCYAAGALFVVAVWASVETLLPVLGSLLGLGVAWLVWRRDFALKQFHMAVGAFVTALAALFLEQGFAGYADPVYEVDRFSLFHVFLFGLFFVFWVGLYLWDRGARASGRWAWRLALAAAGSGAAFLLIWAVYPQFFTEPWFPVDELYRRVRWGSIQESQPLLSGAALAQHGAVELLVRALMWIGNAAPAGLFLVYMLARRERGQQEFWTYLAVALAVVLAFAALSHGLTFRDMPTLFLLLIFPFTELVARITGSLEGFRLPWRPVARVSATVALIVWPMVTSLALKTSGEATEATEVAEAGCPITPMAEFLGNETPWRDEPQWIMAFVDYGPEILYRTHHSIFSYPNHRYQSGFTDSYRAMTATEEEEARAILERRRVDLVLICDSLLTASFYWTAENETTLWQRLAGEDAPDWLAPVPLPAGLEERFRLYRFEHGRTGE
jgi:hypothetical protein